MATGIYDPLIKSKLITGTTTATGTLVYDTSGITAVVGAIPDPGGEFKYCVGIPRGDKYVQIFDSATGQPGQFIPITNANISVQIFYI